MKKIQHTLQFIGIIIILPVITAGLLGILLSPLQSSARLPKAIRTLEANDLPASHQDTLQDGQHNMLLSNTSIENEPEDLNIFEENEDPINLNQDNTILYADNTESLTNEVNYQFAQDIYDSSMSESWYTSEQLFNNGVIYDGSRYYTWYSEKTLAGEGLDIPGRHVSDEGYILDEYDRIVVASCMYAYQEEIDIPFGNGRAIVLDYCAGRNVVDIYTNF